MNAKAEKLRQELDEAIDKITINEPIDSKRCRLGLMDPPAGAWNQYFTNHFFADAELRGMGANSLTIIDHAINSDLFNIEQVRVIVDYTLPFSGEFLDYAGFRDTWAFIKRFIDLAHECDVKADLKDVCRSLMIFVNYTHAWSHLFAPWGAGGAGYNFRSKEEIDDIVKYYKEEEELKKDYPYDRAQRSVLQF